MYKQYSVFVPACSPQRWPSALHCRHYGYIHVPKKKPPHILGPSEKWRKCFIVHPRTQALDPLTKYQWLTKTAVVQDLPDRLTKQPLANNDTISGCVEHARETLMCQHRDELTSRDLSAGLLQSTLLGLWTRAHRHHHLVYSNLTFEPRVESYWRRSKDNFLCISHPLYILHTHKPLELFCEPEFQGEGIPPLQYKPFHLGLFQRSVDQIQPFGGCKRYSPYSFTHTIFIADQDSRTREQLLAHLLMQLFSQAAAETVQNGYPLDQDLTYPLVTQGIATNGRQFTFACFQLNTLDLSHEAAQRVNVFWAGPTLALYKGQNFNEECIGLILQLLLQAPLRQRPSLSGFTLPKPVGRGLTRHEKMKTL